MKKKILFIGNCQISICQFLSLYTFFNENFTFDKYHIYSISTQEFINIHDKLDSYDYIVTQMISDDFRQNEKIYESSPFSTTFLQSKMNHQKTKLIMFPSCYFNFAFPFSSSRNNNYIEDIIEEYHQSNKTMQDYENFIDHKLHFTIDEMKERFNCSVRSLEERELCAFQRYKPDYFIFVSEFIIENSKKCLFYTFNHPSHLILNYIAMEIAKILVYLEFQNEKALLDLLSIHKSTIDPLDKYKAPIMLCFQPFFDFDLSEYNKNLMFRGQKCDVRKFYKLYCDQELRKSLPKSFSKNKFHFLSNKNIYSYMEKQIMKCTSLKKSSSKQPNCFVKCTTTSSMFNSVSRKKSDSPEVSEKTVKTTLIKKKMPGKFIPQSSSVSKSI